MVEASGTLWKARSGWVGHAQAGRAGRGTDVAGVRLQPLGRRALATLIAGPGLDRALDEAVRACFGCGLPTAGRTAFGVAGGLVWSGPGQWLAVAEGETHFAAWPQKLAGLAAVTDQTDARALVRVGGRNARTALAKGVSIDLHPAVFTAGSAAATSVAHIAIQLWRPTEAESYVIAVPRSFAGSFWSWLITAAASFGTDVVEEDV